MNKLTKAKWRDNYGDDLNVSVLREIFSPPTRFRVSEYSYPAGTISGGTMRAGKCFVTAGTINYCFDDCEVQLDVGEWIELPSGEFNLVVSDDDAKLIHVWEIPGVPQG